MEGTTPHQAGNINQEAKKKKKNGDGWTVMFEDRMKSLLEDRASARLENLHNIGKPGSQDSPAPQRIGCAAAVISVLGR